MATTLMNLEEIMPNKIGQSQKDKICGIPLYEVPGVIKRIETESRVVVPGAGGMENWELVFNEYECQFGKINKFWR